METSETIGKLAAALAKAQGLITGAQRDSENPFFKSKYADLASVWDAVRIALAGNELSIVQVPYMCPDGTVGLTTILMHASGEYIRGNMCMKPVKSDPQGIGSVISYLRRYCLASYTGCAQVDDDGNAASQPKVPERAPQPSDPRETKTYHIAPEREKDVPELLGDDKPTKEKTVKFLKEQLNGMMLGFTDKQKADFVDYVMGGKDKDDVKEWDNFIQKYFEYRNEWQSAVKLQGVKNDRSRKN